MTPDFEHQGLRIAVFEDAGRVLAEWTGVGDTREPGPRMHAFLDALIDGLHGRELTVDFRRCEYLNSAGIAPIIRFVKDLDARGISATLVFDETQEWQRLNARSLRAISRLLTGIEVQT